MVGPEDTSWTGATDDTAFKSAGGASGNTDSSETPDGPQDSTDRVVSLLPAATELCYALGVEPVGVTAGCDHPPAVTDLPVVSRPAIETAGPSAAVDDAVQSVAESDGVFDIDYRTLEMLDPDYVLTQGTCSVCAVDDSTLRSGLTARDIDANIVCVDPHSLDEMFDALRRLGGLFGRDRRASAVLTELREQVRALDRATPPASGRPPDPAAKAASAERATASTPDAREADRPRVVVLDWLDPVMVAGHWVPGLLDTAGASSVLSDPGDRSRPREWATIREVDPDVIVAAPCGFDLTRTLSSAADLTAREGWDSLSAVADGRVYAVDGNHYVNRPGPRLVDTLELFAGIVHPDTVDPPAGAVRPLEENSTPNGPMEG